GNFSASVSGVVAAQPLFLEAANASGNDLLIVATQNNQVSAFDADAGGTPIWQRSLGPSVPKSDHPDCGENTIGIAGTPVIDGATRTLYVDAYIHTSGGAKHRIFALSADDGTTRSGWPVDVDSAVSGFDSSIQYQRPALSLFQGTVYVAYGGHIGDCDDY